MSSQDEDSSLLAHPILGNPRTIAARQHAILRFRRATLCRVAGIPTPLHAQRYHHIERALLAAADGLGRDRLTPFVDSLDELHRVLDAEPQTSTTDSLPDALCRSRRSDLGVDELQRRLMIAAVIDAFPDATEHDLRVPTADDLDLFARAYGRLNAVCPRLAATTFDFCNACVVVALPGARSFSTSRMPGVVFVGESEMSDSAELAESLLHEALHLKLFAISEASPLFDADALTADHETFRIPWRSYTSESPWGVDRLIAASHLYAHLAFLSDRPGASEAFPSGPVARDRAECLLGLLDGARSLSNSGRELGEWLETLLGGPVHQWEEPSDSRTCLATPNAEDQLVVTSASTPYRNRDLALSLLALEDRNEVKVLSPFAMLVADQCTHPTRLSALIAMLQKLVPRSGEDVASAVERTVSAMVSSGLLRYVHGG